MQKKFLCLALSGLFSGGVFAQTNVTVYGNVDIGYFHQNLGSGRTTSSIDSHGMSRSMIGFKGSEDLGNGLKATFNLAYRLANDQNTGIGTMSAPNSNTIADEQSLGLEGNFGTVKAGRLTTSATQFGCSTNVLAATAFDGLTKLNFNARGVISMLGCTNNSRMNNAVGYWSPKFSGFGFQYSYARAPQGTEMASSSGQGNRDNVGQQLGVTYNGGPLYLMAIAARQTGDDATPAFLAGLTPRATDAAIREYGIGGSYDFGVAKLVSSYQTMKAEHVRSNAKDKRWTIGAAIPVMGTDVLKVTYAAVKRGDTATLIDNDAKAWGVAYEHSLSKRTAIYGGYSKLTNQNANTDGHFNAVSGPTPGSIPVPLAGDDPSIWGFGMRHSF